MKIDRTGLGLRHDSISAYKINERQSEEENLASGKTKGKKDLDTVELSTKAKKLFAAQKTAENTQGDNPLKDALIRSNVVDSEEQAARISGKVEEKMEANDIERQKRLEMIKQRLNDGFYDSPEVYDKIAAGLMKDMNINE
ncbi:MAG: hypothetical protein DWQ05_19250 [Calditrichaeota bacterium]|nr:MAG: hypothetical protein DWQ05_19250 [Calditrichota bacterium]